MCRSACVPGGSSSSHGSLTAALTPTLDPRNPPSFEARVGAFGDKVRRMRGALLSIVLLLGCGSPITEASGTDAGPGVDAGPPSLFDAGPAAGDAGSDPDAGMGGTDAGAPTCPPGVVCVDGFPFTHTDTTADSTNRTRDTYACAPDVNESGPERFYSVQITEAGFLALGLTGSPSGVDVDVHLLAADGACIDRGHIRAGAWVEPGRYEVIVDTYVADGVELAGEYTLSFGLTTPSALATAGLDRMVAERALRVFDRAWLAGETNRLEYAIVDFGLHSRREREWVVDLTTGDVLWTLFVAHGEGSSSASDPGRAVTFSNVSGSHQSSLGLMRTGELYVGTFGPSHRLDGLEPGINDNVRSRAIVMHPWEGSRAEYVASNGITQETWGCPAIDDRVTDTVRQRMAGGALMWFWAPDASFQANSQYLRGL